VRYRKTGASFVNDFPLWVAQRRAKRAAGSQAASKQATQAAPPIASGATPSLPLVVPVPAFQSSASEDESPTGVQTLPDGSSLQFTAEGRVELTTPTSAQLEMRHVLSEIGDLSRLGDPLVVRALSGVYGRLEQQENEAFVRMRAVCFYPSRPHTAQAQRALVRRSYGPATLRQTS